MWACKCMYVPRYFHTEWYAVLNSYIKQWNHQWYFGMSSRLSAHLVLNFKCTQKYS